MDIFNIFNIFNIGFPVAALLGGIGLIALGIHEKNKTALKERRKENAVYRSSTKDSSAKTEPETAVEVAAETIEDAQEVK